MVDINIRPVYYCIHLMKEKENTKNKILEIGAEIIHLKGFNHTGIQVVLLAAKVPKGSFYNYFRNKEDYGLQIIDYFSGSFEQMTQGILEDTSTPPLDKIKKILEWFIGFFESKDFGYGCPIGNLAQEMGDLSSRFRERLMAALDAMIVGYAELLTEAQRRGELSGQVDVRETANYIVSSWHGALVHMKIMKSPKPLQDHIRFLFKYILKA